VADVSGKGVPAALYMMRAKSQIQMLASIGLPLNDVLTETNKRLCLNNNAKMFVTVWIGCLDIRNGNLKYINAGHNPPLIIKKSKDPMWIKEKSGIFPGAFKKSKYKQFELQMEKGDTMLLYTDGVTEAFNSAHEAYGNERLFDIMKFNDCSNAPQIINKIYKDIDDFTGSMEQYDDITMLCIQFKG
jgi:sigma-B regulation protein RsbU (phosphoserine phosphatase)